ncbi:hypothetical protein DSO57_1011546 [Entomophthora muscae]|uniref:Uncharacterized protein n=2 Tax=Entomophthora muscae TaxID=34485 RepID=A0ACC2U3Y7_9FUNG|nr:hypothetical protein DSO57_1003502 [Entomophthora muscae]KAJ9081729.1 hypothetical protein DSO57_1011546 [Entomophthora muscae]
MSPTSKIHTPRYASQPSGRRSISENHRVVESVLSDDLVAHIRMTEFDDMLSNGFNFSKLNNLCGLSPSSRKHTLKLTLTPSNANDKSFFKKRLSILNF